MQKAHANGSAVDKGLQLASDTLKDKLLEVPILMAPDSDQPFLLQTHASEFCLGAVLLQKRPDGKFYPVSFIRRKFLPRETNYSVTKEEYLADLDYGQVATLLVGKEVFCANRPHSSWLALLVSSTPGQPGEYVWVVSVGLPESTDLRRLDYAELPFPVGC